MPPFSLAPLNTYTYDAALYHALKSYGNEWFFAVSIIPRFPRGWQLVHSVPK